MLILARDRRRKSANEFLHGITVRASNVIPNLWLSLVISDKLYYIPELKLAKISIPFINASKKIQVYFFSDKEDK